jgi:hypothetical protein
MTMTNKTDAQVVACAVTALAQLDELAEMAHAA